MLRSTCFALLLSLVACDAGGGAGPDPDAGGPRGPVTVTTFHDGSTDVHGPQAGVDVIAIDPDGTTRAAQSDTSGHADLDVVDGGSVAAIYTDDYGFHHVHAVLDVAAGDHLVFGDDIDKNTQPRELGTMTLDVPAFAAATTYSAYGTCHVSGYSDYRIPSIPLTAYDDCTSSDLYVFATDTDADLLGYAVIPALAFTDGGTITLDAWQTPTSLTFDVVPLPAGLQYGSILGTMAMENGWGQLGGVVEMPPSGGALSTTVAWAPVGTAAMAMAELTTDHDQQRIQEAIDPTATQHTFVPRDLRLRDLTTDLAAASVEVTADGAATTDETVVDFDFGVPADWTFWEVVAPPIGAGTTTITLPTLPAPFDGDNPRATDMSSGAAVTAYEISGYDGYDDIRQVSQYSIFDPAREQWYVATSGL